MSKDSNPSRIIHYNAREAVQHLHRGDIKRAVQTAEEVAFHAQQLFPHLSEEGAMDMMVEALSSGCPTHEEFEAMIDEAKNFYRERARSGEY